MTCSDVVGIHKVPPHFILKPKDKVVVENSTTVLHCVANGRDRSGAQPRITWLKDGSTLDRFLLVEQWSYSILRSVYHQTSICNDLWQNWCLVTYLKTSHLLVLCVCLMKMILIFPQKLRPWFCFSVLHQCCVEVCWNFNRSWFNLVVCIRFLMLEMLLQMWCMPINYIFVNNLYKW